MAGTPEGEAFRDCMIEIADCARTIADDDFCLRLYDVKIVRRRWDGPELGLGDFRDSTLEPTPTPRVREPTPYLLRTEGGSYETGDRIVDRISQTYTLEQLTGVRLEKCEEFFWLIDGEKYAVHGEPVDKYTQWKVHLKRMNRRRRT